MPINRREMKQTAKACIRSTVPAAIWVALIFLLINYVLSSIFSQVYLNESGFYALMNNPDQLYYALENGYTPSFSFFGSLLTLVISIVGLILTYGFLYYTLLISRGKPAGFGNLFDGFSRFFKILWLSIRMGIIVWLWSLLFVVPGIIAAYRYSQAPFLLLDHPDWSAKQCMRESRRLMHGYKWKYFVLQLSFIGWYILTIIPFVSIYVEPYANTTYAVFYNKLIGWQPDEPEELPGFEKAPWEY